MLVSVLLVGMKLTVAKELVQTVERRKELKSNLSLLRSTIEDEDLIQWLSDVAYDMAQRQETVDALESATDQTYTTADSAFIDNGTAIFADYDMSSAPVSKTKSSATICRLETKRHGWPPLARPS